MTGTSRFCNNHIHCSYAEIQFLFSKSAISLGFSTSIGNCIGRLACYIAKLGLDPTLYILPAFDECQLEMSPLSCRPSVDESGEVLVFSGSDNCYVPSLLYAAILKDWLIGDRPLMFKNVPYPILLGLGIGIFESKIPIYCQLSDGICVRIESQGISVYGGNLENPTSTTSDVQINFTKPDIRQDIGKFYAIPKKIPAAKIGADGWRHLQRYFELSLVVTEDSSGAGA